MSNDITAKKAIILIALSGIVFFVLPLLSAHFLGIAEPTQEIIASVGFVLFIIALIYYMRKSRQKPDSKA